MYPERYVHVGNKVWGQLPSGEIHEYDSPFLYHQAYKAEADEIYDECARLEAERIVELPEDFVYA